MCYQCYLSAPGASWSTFDHDWDQSDGAAPADLAHEWSVEGFDLSQLALPNAGDEPMSLEEIAWSLAGQASPTWFDSAWNWLNNNVSAVPLWGFSAAASILPNSSVGYTKYFIPTNVDSKILAVMSGSQWRYATVSYSFPDSRWDYDWINPSAEGFKRLSPDVEQKLQFILEGSSQFGTTGMKLTSVESFTGVDFVYTGRNGANLQMSGFIPNETINRSHGYYPGVPVFGGDLWLQHGDQSAPIGSYNYYLLLHEMGHTLGLKHPHDSAGALPAMDPNYDSTQYTVMSYNTYTGNPQTYMMYDIAALQEMYGADFTTNSGNTVYSWNAATGEAYVNGVGQGVPGSNKIFLTIWDGGGTDTYDLRNYNGGVEVDLAPGGYSMFSPGQKTSGYTKGNVYNALQFRGDTRSLIENALTGWGNDKVLGNVADNMVDGGAGNDSLYGGNGNDTLWGGAGDDLLDDWNGAGYFGNDYFDGGAGNDGLYGRYGNDYLFGQDGNDTLDGGEDSDTLGGGDGNDRSDGGAGHDYIDSGDGDDMNWGGAGNDTIYAGAGNDHADSGDGNDLIFGQDGNDNLWSVWGDDTVYGGSGVDTIWGGTGQDLLYGDSENDYVYGEAGYDTLFGGDGDDVLDGGSGDDFLYGGAGADRLNGGEGSLDLAFYGNASAGVTASLADPATNTGEAAGDTYSGIEGLSGTAYNDVLVGDGSNNYLFGRLGNDLMMGGMGDDVLDADGGDDTLAGGDGADTMWGCAGRDVFVFNTALSASNVDRVMDFNVYEDRICLDKSIFTALPTGTMSSLYFTTQAGSSVYYKIVYSSSTGALYYDADGSGAAPMVKFAQLSAGLALSAGNFYVV